MTTSVQNPHVTVFKNAYLIDCTGRAPVAGATVIVEGERIKDVLEPGSQTPVPGGDDVDIVDLKGKTLMPGLTDAHVHLNLFKDDVASEFRHYPASYIAINAGKRATQMLGQGFTTVRDMGGADSGVRDAIANGLIPGPRLLVSCHFLSQTNGHGDVRDRADTGDAACDCATLANAFIADGPDAVRKGVREQLHEGADQIKIMAGGGVLSLTDKLESTQYSAAELEAAVEEAAASGTYVAAHAHGARAVQNAAEAGIRSVEHGTLLDDAAIAAMQAHGTYLVPTLTVIELTWQAAHQSDSGLTPDQIAKLDKVHDGAIGSLDKAYRAGLKIGSGTDIGAPPLDKQALELVLKGQVMRPMDVLVSATKTNAEIFQMDEDIGTVEKGKLADLIVVNGNPLEDLSLFQNTDNLRFIMKGGTVYKDTTGS